MLAYFDTGYFVKIIVGNSYKIRRITPSKKKIDLQIKKSLFKFYFCLFHKYLFVYHSMNIFYLFRICFLYNTNNKNNKSILVIFQLKL